MGTVHFKPLSSQLHFPTDTSAWKKASVGNANASEQRATGMVLGETSNFNVVSVVMFHVPKW